MNFGYKKIATTVVLVVFIILSLKCSNQAKKSQVAMKIADVFAMESSLLIRENIEKSSACSEIPEGWESAEYNERKKLMIKKGNKNGLFRVVYECNTDLSFSVSVLYSFDSGTYYSGRPNKEIEIIYGHFTEPMKLYIDNRSDIESTLKQMYD